MGMDQAGLTDLMAPSPSTNPTVLLKNPYKNPHVPLIPTNQEKILIHSIRINR